MKILVLDNYDSFTYNLVRYVRELCNAEVDVFRNDKISLNEIDKYDKIILSPGPGIPNEAGILKDLIAEYGSKKSILGICLGCQAIGEVYGASLENMEKVYHGIASQIKITDKEEKLFRNIPINIKVGRYHSWIISRDSLPKDLIMTSEDEDGNIMGIRHKDYDVSGVQFHPESILTPEGKKMIYNFINP